MADCKINKFNVIKNGEVIGPVIGNSKEQAKELLADVGVDYDKIKLVAKDVMTFDGISTKDHLNE